MQLLALGGQSALRGTSEVREAGLLLADRIEIVFEFLLCQNVGEVVEVDALLRRELQVNELLHGAVRLEVIVQLVLGRALKHAVPEVILDRQVVVLVDDLVLALLQEKWPEVGVAAALLIDKLAVYVETDHDHCHVLHLAEVLHKNNLTNIKTRAYGRGSQRCPDDTNLQRIPSMRGVGVGMAASRRSRIGTGIVIQSGLTWSYWNTH